MITLPSGVNYNRFSARQPCRPREPSAPNPHSRIPNTSPQRRDTLVLYTHPIHSSYTLVLSHAKILIPPPQCITTVYQCLEILSAIANDASRTSPYIDRPRPRAHVRSLIKPTFTLGHPPPASASFRATLDAGLPRASQAPPEPSTLGFSIFL